MSGARLSAGNGLSRAADQRATSSGEEGDGGSPRLAKVGPSARPLVLTRSAHLSSTASSSSAARTASTLAAAASTSVADPNGSAAALAAA
eukprot:CAMPEP_0174728434 /NCGR_PEP_ID=MMETSP1094-20130205/51734_1 /TAXON_ID=156173 /ORGANISM="Chrysochromulina brevifilum, Strain UTEX LB 985" /LENGTH=89 /DNA_ID=CAMNT_0015930353 /DNA_START=431 /DNA_END=697 /DNA_ORIENTATION=-